ncbi:MAG: glycosyltransferase family 4 protein [Bacteroidetes bacterium]|nr:glycosyltransferase family 4 protein [Bacteroidota bacterium]MBU1679456.1 glycosyltransferase family 4 protein [Bacteroidota bacterium]MBU2505789.1 glycosyltransferase family 4 protein [Bacteroidota bacterium]
MVKGKLGILSPDIRPVCGRSRIVIDLCLELEKRGIDFLVFTNKSAYLSACNISTEKIKYLPSALKFNPLREIVSLLLLIWYTKKYDIKIYHSHHRKVEFLSFIVSKIFNVKTVMSVHSELTSFKNISYKSDVLVAVSNHIAQNLKSVYNKKNVRVIYNGTKINEQLNTISSLEPFKILYLGRFEKHKGYDLLINAVLGLSDKILNIHLYFIGEGEDLSILRKSILDNKLISTVRKSNNVYLRYLITCNLLVLPSRIESFGLAAIEAGMAGLPIVASNTGGLKEVIRNNEDGLLFESGNSLDLQNKILEVYHKYSIALERANHFRSRVAEEFSIERMADNYISVYMNLLGLKDKK